MNSILATASLFLAIFFLTNNIHAFAPTTTSNSPLAHRSKLSLSLNEFSFLISDAADAIADVSSAAVDAVTSADNTAVSDVATSAVEETKSFLPTSTYSKASYYTTLALYAASFPGLWRQIKRSTKAKVKRKTYVR